MKSIADPNLDDLIRVLGSLHQSTNQGLDFYEVRDSEQRRLAGGLQKR